MEERKLKKYYLEIKLKKGKNIEYITLLKDTLSNIDKVTAISYTKEQLLLLLYPQFIDYILDNYDKADLVITYKYNNIIKELPVVTKNNYYYAYVTVDELERVIQEEILSGKQENGIRRTLSRYYSELVKLDYNLKYRKEKDIKRLHYEQIGKRYVVYVLNNMGLLKNKKNYIPTEFDINLINELILKMYLESKGIAHERNQMNLYQMVSNKIKIYPIAISKEDKIKYSRIFEYDVLEFLRRKRFDPNAIYYIDNSYRVFEKIPKRPNINIQYMTFEEYSEIEDERDRVKTKRKIHNNHQKPVKGIYTKALSEYKMGEA